jgi:hypothetical protein
MLNKTHYLISGSNVRRIFGSDGIDATIYLNWNDSADPDNFNVKISGLVLQNSINNLMNSVNVNTLNISALDTIVSSGFLARYTTIEVNK